ncbi:MAG TPA: hypothetical protein VF121_16885 [Thermoanaerobaculia bacterium]|nr:hypothetical protein [Thermoanaerobaculia bacterium]
MTGRPAGRSNSCGLGVYGLRGGLLEAPEIDLGALEIYLGERKIDLGVGKIHLEAPEIDLGAAEIDLQAPEIDLGAQEIDLHAWKSYFPTRKLDLRLLEIYLRAPEKSSRPEDVPRGAGKTRRGGGNMVGGVARACPADGRYAFDDPEVFAEALRAYAAGCADFSDYLIGARSRAKGARTPTPSTAS